MGQVGGERFEELLERISESSQRRAANTRAMLEELERRRGEAREQGRNFTAPTEEQLLNKLERR